MKNQLTKKSFPFILLAGIPLLTLVGCASNDTTDATNDMNTTQLEVQSVKPSSEFTVAKPELQTEESSDILVVENEQKNTQQSTELYPSGIQITEPEEVIIGFEFDKSEITEQYREILKQHAEYLANNNQLTLQVNGHTDSMGPRAYNEWLSQQRADAVVKLLVEFGAPEDQIVVSGLADNEPMTDATHNREHRRVELNYQEHRMVSK